MSVRITSYAPSNKVQNGYQRANTCRPRKRKTYYFTTGRPVTMEAIKDMENEILKPYAGALDLDSMDNVKRYWENEKNKKLKEREADCANHHTYRSRVNLLWKSERLFVPDDIKLPGGSLTEDIDPNFFKIVSGRPIREKKGTREYLRDIRDCFLARLKTGYCFDEILLMDELHINEMQRLRKAKNGFFSSLKGFEGFLEEDHVSSWSLLESAKEYERKSRQKLEMINNLKEELRNLEADVLVVYEKWRNLRVFEKFLYRISPTEWRKAHDPYYGREGDEILGTDRFPEGGTIDLNDMIAKFQEDVRRSQPPALYFTQPQEIVNIFMDLEKNNLRALTHCKDVDFPAEEIMAELEKKKAKFSQEQTYLQGEIKYLKDLVEAEESNFRRKESEMKKIAFGLFRDLITNEEYLSATSYVEDAYEDAVAPSDGSLDLIAMMKQIELKHESLLLALDKSPNVIVTRTMKQFYKAQKRELREAREADKKVRQMELLLKRLSKALSHPKKGMKERKIMPRSQPPEEVMFEFKLPKIPSKEEREQMFFFGRAPETVRLYRPLCL